MVNALLEVFVVDDVLCFIVPVQEIGTNSLFSYNF